MRNGCRASRRRLQRVQTRSPRTIWPGSWYPLGATFDGDGCNFSVFSEVAERVELCLFDDDGSEQRVDLPETRTFCWHGYVPGVSPGSATASACTAPGIPRAASAAIPHKLLLDPYAKAIEGQVDWDPAVFPFRIDDDGDRDEDRPARSTARPSCRDRSSWTRDSTGATTGGPAARCIRPRSTSCTSRASRRACRTSRRELRGTYAGLAHPAVDRLPDAARRQRRRADAGAPVRARRPPRRARAAQLLGLQLDRLLRAAQRYAERRPARRAGARVQGDGQGAARRRHRGDPRRRLQPHRRGQPPRADAVVQGPRQPRLLPRRWPTSRATTWTTRAPATA